MIMNPRPNSECMFLTRIDAFFSSIKVFTISNYPTMLMNAIYSIRIFFSTYFMRHQLPSQKTVKFAETGFPILSSLCTYSKQFLPTSSKAIIKFLFFYCLNEHDISSQFYQQIKYAELLHICLKCKPINVWQLLCPIAGEF